MTCYPKEVVILSNNDRLTICQTLLDMPEWTLIYRLDEENSKKFIDILKEKHSGSIEEMITSAFGKNLATVCFDDFFDRKGIKYEYDQELTV